MIDFQDAFISYGRADSQAFCTTLYERLLASGCRVWFDQNDIPLGVDFQNQIDDGIEKAHNFLFVISPHSVNSPYCLKEIELALRLNKRIIPLLHVEKISQETWQQRNPGKGEEDWQAYQAQGLHSCFANMHPAIGKINWVYFREGIDDFEQSLAGLLTIFERQKEYVELHTQLLARSLEWERHYRETRYLLTGDDRTEAENWLSVSFQGEQAPCEPTDLHCEYICESIKNANNLMTQVFLCYSPKDEAIAKVVSRALMRQRFTLWSSVLDVEPGDTSDEALRRGIERADNFVFLLSSDSQASKQCQKSLEHAFNYNKRVIPLQVEAASATNRRQKRGLSQIYDRLGDEDENFATISANLQAIQAIDFSRHDDQTQMRAALDRLLQDLTEDANYYEQHKNLLVKALRWQEQHRNPSLLLRGHALRQAEAWLRSAKGRSRQPLLPIQDEFIVESQKHPPDASVAVFISYSMADSDFARKLNNALQTHGKSTWFDQESIASGSDFQQEIFQGIESADNFLFVISPNSIESPYCESEVEHAKQLNKRIIPVMYREVSPADLPAALATTQWVDFRKHQGDFLPNFGELVRALETDLTYVRDHTRLQIRAMEWELEDRDDSFLLRGRQLTRAERWLEQSTTKRPSPTRLQALYVAASLDLPKRKIKPRTAAITGIVAGLAIAVTRFLGVLEPAELAAYDQMLRLRPGEPQDQRFLIVGVDEPSMRLLLRDYEPGKGTIPDSALSQVLERLNQAQPRLIGLDFYRDFAAQPALAEQMRQTQNLITVCKSSFIDDQGSRRDGTLPPPEVSIDRVGYSDLVDDGNRFLRRQYLMQSADEKFCNTRSSLSLVLAQRYLAEENQPFISPLGDDGAYVQDMGFGSVMIPQLLGSGSGYQDTGDRLRGYQTMLNYRVYRGNANAFAPAVSLEALLNNQVSPDLIRNRIVLIGITDRADASADFWDTPYGEMPGVVAQAQMTSQIISAALDGRPLIWWWSVGVETLWLLAWSTAGAFIVRRSSDLRSLLIRLGGTVVVLWGAGYVILALTHGWVPVVPPAIAVILSGVGVSYLTYRLRQSLPKPSGLKLPNLLPNPKFNSAVGQADKSAFPAPMRPMGAPADKGAAASAPASGDLGSGDPGSGNLGSGAPESGDLG